MGGAGLILREQVTVDGRGAGQEFFMVLTVWRILPPLLAQEPRATAG